MLQAGADANAKDEQGHRPLDAAAGEGDRDMMKLLKPKTVPYISDWTLDGLLAHSKTAVHAQGEDESHQVLLYWCHTAHGVAKATCI